MCARNTNQTFFLSPTKVSLCCEMKKAAIALLSMSTICSLVEKLCVCVCGGKGYMYLEITILYSRVIESSVQTVA